MSRHEPTTVGSREQLAPKETLTSQRGSDGLWHAFYARGTRTLCYRPILPFKALEEWPPTCPICQTTAAAWDRIDSSAPDHWRLEIGKDAA